MKISCANRNAAFIIRHIRKILGILGAIFVVVAISVSMKINVTEGFEPFLLLPVLNTFFIGILGIIASVITAKIYVSTKMISVLIMGCGILAFALGAASSGWFRFFPDGANISVTIYNTSAMFGSVLHITGALFGFRTEHNQFANTGNVRFKITVSYSCVCLLMAILSITAMQGLLPRFFIQGTGPTLLRQSVLWTAIILYLSTAFIFFTLYIKSKFDYLFWYSFSMSMIALGLYVVSTIQVVGSPASWAGRLAVFVGSIFAFIAVLVLVRTAKMNEVSMGQVVTNFFIDSEANYKDLTETLSDAIISVDHHFTVFFANTAAEKMFGYNKMQFIGSNFLETLVPAQYKDLISHGRPFFSEEDDIGRNGSTEPVTDKIIDMEIQTKDGRLIPVELSVTIRKINKGLVRTYIIRDITERKGAEALVKLSNETLQLRVHERTAQLEDAIKELESFSYSVSHDLRAPLRHMMGFVELLNKNSQEMLDEKNIHYLSVISGAANKMGHLIDDLLLFSRMGRVEMLNTRVDIHALALEIIDSLKPETEGRNVEWSIQHVPDARGDRNMLYLVLSNLFSNAVKFTRPKQLATIEFGITSIDQSNGNPAYYINDNGVGFDMRYADKLFGIFQRLHRQEEFEGTGVGLANVERILHRHGCTIWAEGIPNQGATFYFTLPKWEEI